MQLQIRSRGIAAVAGTALLVFSGVASAQLDKQETKCANSINKGAAKVAKAQAGDNAACIRDGGKGRLSGTIEDCLVSDPKGKISKAIGKIKTSDCPTGAPTFLPGLQTDSSTIGDTMVQKDLDLVHAIFGSDLDLSIVNAEDDKAGARCQSAIAKAAGKCQDAKLSSYNSCKKEELKAVILSAATLRDACLGVGVSGIPDPKGKIDKKCGNGLGGTVDKKCAVPNTNALFPPCAGQNLGNCLDEKIECEVCQALNALDGLDRNCDEFDDGVASGSCGGQPNPCGEGAFVGGLCWYDGLSGESCDQTCEALSLVYDEATRTFAGSDGTDANCFSVLDGLGIFHGPGIINFCTAALGCASAAGQVVRCVDGPMGEIPTTATAGLLGAFRMCGCMSAD